MRRLLGTLALLTLLVPLAGCGDDADPVSAATDTSSEDPVPPGEPEPEVLELLDETAVGGEVTELLQPVTTDATLSAFVEQFSRGTFGAEIEDAVAEARTGYADVLAAVVSIGCDVPPDVAVTEQDGAYVAVPGKVADPLPECLAPVTTVAVVGLNAR